MRAERGGYLGRRAFAVLAFFVAEFFAVAFVVFTAALFAPISPPFVLVIAVITAYVVGIAKRAELR